LRHLGIHGFLAPEDNENFTYFPFPTTSPRLESLEVDTQLFSNLKQALVALTALPSTIRHLRFAGRQGYPSLVDGALAPLISSESPAR
jgi:hypothetical protein